MFDALTAFSTRRTRQSRRADARQVENSAGGHVFELTDAQQLRRFLTLGTDGGTYYASAQDLTVENAECVLRMAEEDHRTLVETVVDVSTRGAAPRQNPALFALAIATAHGSDDERSYALSRLADVARTGTHLFLFARYVEQFRGWGRGLRRAVGDWYLSKDVDAVAYQVVKYQQREGWSHRDLLRLAHPVTVDPQMRATFDWIVRGSTGEEQPRLIEGFTKVHEDGADVAALVRDYRLSWEMLPDAALGDRAVWDALLDVGVPQTALMRQLPRLTNLGMLPDSGGRTAEIAARLSDAKRLRKARVHPINVLVAQRTYASGKSARGSGTWSPSRTIVDSLDAAFYHAFGAVEPSGKRTLIALDVSGSMMAQISNMPLSCREASAALALVTMAVEDDVEVVGFTSTVDHSSWNGLDTAITPLSISPRQRLDDVTRAVSGLSFGRTDCALPMTWAQANQRAFDSFVIFTDNETWSGGVHPHQAIRSYRQSSGINATVAVIGMTATGFSIADPSDAGMLDIAGFDSAVPNLLADFARGF